MSRVYTSKKSPWAAGILSVIPGLGQIYNEQTGKGLVMFILFLGSFLFFVMRAPLLHLLPEYGWPNIGLPLPFFFKGWFPSWGSLGLARIYPITWFIILLPCFVVISILDAVQNARRINARFSPANATPAAYSSNGSNDLNRRPGEAPPTMREHAAGDHFNFSEKTMNNPNVNNAPSNGTDQTPPKKHAHGASSKFFLGIVLMIIGGIFILEQIDLNILSWATWNRLWPLIPLLFGLRLLRDYQLDKDRGQYVLGAGFLAVGVIFLLENWEIFSAWAMLRDFWMFFLFGAGAFFVLVDLLERRRRRE